MTSDEILHTPISNPDLMFVKEIAYQLAVIREDKLRNTELLALRVGALEMRLQHLGSTVGADSDKALREKCPNCSHQPDAKPLSRDNARCLDCGRWVYLDRYYVADERTARSNPQPDKIQTRSTLDT